MTGVEAKQTVQKKFKVGMWEKRGRGQRWGEEPDWRGNISHTPLIAGSEDLVFDLQQAEKRGGASDKRGWARGRKGRGIFWPQSFLTSTSGKAEPEVQQELSSSMVWFRVAWSSRFAFLAEVKASATQRGGANQSMTNHINHRLVSEVLQFYFVTSAGSW